MKRVYTFILSVFVIGQLFAGGILTNSNQSAQYVRMLARNASGEIDAVYYNPAGVMRMDDGFHLYLGNQSLFQTRTITTAETLFPMNNSIHEGEVNAYLFPNFYAVYKKEKWALALGFGPNGGGGSAEFKTGLPMFERPVAAIPGALSLEGMITDSYSLDAYFNGSSVYYGTQVNFTYKVNDMLSLGAGVRMINAKNAYEGYLRDIMINPDLSTHALGAYLPTYTGDMTSASTFFSDMSGALSTIATSAYGGAAAMNDLVTAVPDLTFAQAEAAVPTFDAAARTQLETGLLNFGIPQAQIDAMTLSQAQATYTSIGEGYTQSATDAAANSEATSDIKVDAKQSGLAFTPILSANITPVENLNIAVKYEMNTKLELTNDTKEDGSGLFTDDSTFRADIPAILTIGIEYGIGEKLRIQAGYITYFDKNADWGGRENYIEKNLYELAFGIEYNISDKLLASAGYSHGQSGPMDEYQSELSYTNSSHTIGLGLQYKASDQLSIDLGVMKSIYVDHTVDYIDESAGYPYQTTYGKKTIGFGIGASYTF